MLKSLFKYILIGIVISISTEYTKSTISILTELTNKKYAQMVVYSDFTVVHTKCIDQETIKICQRILKNVAAEFNLEILDENKLYTGTLDNAEIIKKRIVYLGKDFLNIQNGV